MNRPDIVLITCHDIGRHLGCYGVSTVSTPNLDRLAAAGVRFDSAFSTSCGCSPSRASIATGRYPHSNGVMGLSHPPFDWDLNPDEIHMAGMLGDAGYETHLFGFQHVSPDTSRLGFDGLHCDGMTDCASPGLGCNVRLELETFLQAPRTGRPLYIELNLEEPHRPYDQGGATADATKGVFVPGYLPVGTESTREMAALQGAIRRADENIGEILEMLERAGIAEDAIIVFVGDHGIAMPRAKCTLYDAGIEIALLVSWANGGVAVGVGESELVSNIDIVPTLLELIGIPVPDCVQGQSFTGLLMGTAYAPRSEIYAEKTWHSYYDPMRSIRTQGFKLIRNFEPNPAVEVPADVEQSPIFSRFVERYHAGVHPRLELYDLLRDPDELVNLAAQRESRKIVDSLNMQLSHWMEFTQDSLLNGFVPSPTGSRSAR